MSDKEENKGQDDQKKQDDTGTGNPAMDKAISGGWRPEDEWQGKPEDWIDYREFNVRGELMTRIQEQSGMLNKANRTLEQQKQALKDMAELSDKLAEREYNKIMKQLKAAKAEAVDASDGEQVTEIEDQIDELKAQREEQLSKNGESEDESQDAGSQDDLPPAVVAWLGDPQNSWYHKDPVLKGVADALAQQIIDGNSNLDPAIVLSRMEEQIRKEMPHKFGGTSRVGSGDAQSRGTGAKPKQRKFSDLNEDEQAIAKRLAATGTMTVEKYIEKLDSLGA